MDLNEQWGADFIAGSWEHIRIIGLKSISQHFLGGFNHLSMISNAIRILAASTSWVNLGWLGTLFFFCATNGEPAKRG